MQPDLVSLIGASVKLKRAGRRWIGLCPFHKEKTPSFNLFQSRTAGKWLWNCMGCGEHGDEIDWLRKTRGMTYAQAATELGRPGGWKPDPAIVAAQKAEEARDAAWDAHLDRHPEFPNEYRWLVEGA